MKMKGDRGWRDHVGLGWVVLKRRRDVSDERKGRCHKYHQGPASDKVEDSMKRRRHGVVMT